MRIRRAAKLAALCAVCTLALRAGYILVNMHYQKQFIPAKLNTGMFYAEGSCGDLLSYQGAYVSNLTEQSRAALKAQRARLFDDIQKPANDAPRAYFGGEWLPTPIPNVAAGDGLLENMYCAMDHSWRWPAGIPEALQRRGGYYQTRGGRTLIVLPEQGYVVAVASDR